MKRIRVSVLVAVCALAATAHAQDFSKVEIKTTKVADGVWMLVGAGGNIGVGSGPDGTFVIDDQFAPLTDRIKAAIATITDQPVKFLLNTHWHGDHTGGNENFAKLGVPIFAYDRVRDRMSAPYENTLFGWKSEASPPDALPVITFNDSLTFHINGDDVTCFHVPNAHTDTDVIVWFHKANVVHMGDCLFTGRYPIVDVSSGGSIEGMIAANTRVLKAVTGDAKFIPGHGTLATREDVEKFRDMLVASRDRVKKLIAQKKTLEQAIAAKPLADLDAIWAGKNMTPELWLKVAYADLGRPAAKGAKQK